jgi:hypothetical protein
MFGKKIKIEDNMNQLKATIKYYLLIKEKLLI